MTSLYHDLGGGGRGTVRSGPARSGGGGVRRRRRRRWWRWRGPSAVSGRAGGLGPRVSGARLRVGE